MLKLLFFFSYLFLFIAISIVAINNKDNTVPVPKCNIKSTQTDTKLSSAAEWHEKCWFRYKASSVESFFSFLFLFFFEVVQYRNKLHAQVSYDNCNIYILVPLYFCLRAVSIMTSFSHNFCCCQKNWKNNQNRYPTNILLHISS